MSKILSPMAGKIFKIPVKIGDAVSDGDEVIILESMKMEIPVAAEESGVVKEILVAEGSPVDDGTPLLVLE